MMIALHVSAANRPKSGTNTHPRSEDEISTRSERSADATGVRCALVFVGTTQDFLVLSKDA